MENVPGDIMTKEGEEDGAAAMQILQEPAPLPWSGEELSRFLFADLKTSTCGLRNLGNTCYLNSVLQALAHIPVFATFCTSGWAHHSASPGAGLSPALPPKVRHEFCNYLSKTITKMWSKEFKDFAPRNVNRTMIETVPEFSHNGQQDAEEALTYILNNLHDELFVPVPKEMHPARTSLVQLEKERLEMLEGGSEGKDSESDRIAQAYDAYKRSIVSDSFQSLLAQRVTCDACKQTSLTVQECFTIPLELPLPDTPLTSAAATEAAAAVASKEPTSLWGSLKGMMPSFSLSSSLGGGMGGVNATPIELDDCLKSFFSPEHLRGEEQYYCSKCKCKVDANKTLELVHLPQVLCLQLKRFTSAHAAAATATPGSKRSIFSSNSGGGNGKNFTTVRFPVDDTLDLSAYVKPPAAGGGVAAEEEMEHCKYRLVSVVRHSGSATYGHYVSQCRAQDGTWFCFDDELVSVCKEDVLFRDAYILMYERVPTTREAERKSKALEALKQTSTDAALVSREWAIKFETMCDPGPIDNSALQCEHGLVAFPAAARGMNERVLAIPRAAYDALQGLYGARQEELRALQACPQCKLAHLEREQRRLEESRVVAELDQQQGGRGPFVCVPKAWMRAWTRFVMNDIGPLGRGPFEGAALPGPISFSALYQDLERGELKPGLKPNIHYQPLPLPIFTYLVQQHGLEQASLVAKLLRRDTPDIYAAPLALAGDEDLPSEASANL